MFDGINFFSEYGIEYLERGKNISSSEDWVGLQCPFCGDDSDHLGFCISSGHFTCFKCGWHSQIEVVKTLTDVSWQKAKQIVEKFGGADRKRFERVNRIKDIEVVMPPGTQPKMLKRHLKYLKKRNFNSDKLIETWDLKATGPMGNYKNRIIAPIYYNNTLISYLGRDITGKSSERYKACNQNNERIPHKHSLYGLDYAIGRAALVLEGITDVWRMGIGSLGTMGSTVTKVQILLLNQRFDKVFFLFDPEEAAQKKANQAVMDLSVMGTSAENISLDIDRDPGDMTDKAASYVMRDLLIK